MSWECLKKKWQQAKRFKSDGCTAAPDLFWKDCCTEHDFYYQYPSLTQVSRREADKRLRNCMRSKGSGRIISWIYWVAVRICGWKFWKGKSS